MLDRILKNFRVFSLSKTKVRRSVLDDIDKVVASYTDPTIIETRNVGSMVNMSIFSRLMMERIIFIGTEIDEDMANIVSAQLLWLEQQNEKEDVQLYINSPGGSVSDGLQILSVMDFIKPDVNTIGMGMAASMASILLTSGTPGKRTIIPYGKVLIHQPLGGVRGQATEIEIVANEIQRTKKTLYDIFVKTTGQEYSKIEKDCDRDHYMNAQEALDYHIVDSIIGLEKKATGRKKKA